MSSHRPEEAIRKALGAGFGDRRENPVSGFPEDDTCVIAELGNLDSEFGDWVVSGTSPTGAGYPVAATPSEDGSSKWMGVVLQPGASGKMGRVKTCGVALAKVNDAASLTTGDPLATRSGQVYAELAEESEAVCGRFLCQMPGTDDLSWVHIGGGGAPLEIAIDHHDAPANTRWIDTTTGAPFVGLSWHLFHAEPDAFTGGVDRLMLAIGGGDDHQDEGFCWGGVIGTPAQMGIGRIGGAHSGGIGGVIGPEQPLANAVYRINLRSHAGWNPYDRGYAASLIYPEGVGSLAMAKPPKTSTFSAPLECFDDTDCPTDQGLLWWSGAHIYEHTLLAGGGVSWPGSWFPAIPFERNCISVAPQEITEPECVYPCSSVSNPTQFFANANDFDGSYENILPFGHTPCTGRLDELPAIIALIRHSRALWRWLREWTAWVDTAISCLDSRGIALTACVNGTFGTKQDGAGAVGVCVWDSCCADSQLVTCRTTLPVMNVGPADEDDCAETDCD